MGKTYKQKLEEAENLGISVSGNLLSSENIVGIYKFFRCKDGIEYCFYIGKSTDIAYRLLGSRRGHIYMFLNGNYSQLVPSKIKEYLDSGHKIRVEFFEISYYDTCFSKAAHRLALAELQEIVKYQKMEQCLFQTPEGAGAYEKQYWEKNYNKSNFLIDLEKET